MGKEVAGYLCPLNQWLNNQVFEWGQEEIDQSVSIPKKMINQKKIEKVEMNWQQL